MARKYGICLVVVVICCLVAVGCSGGNAANASATPTQPVQSGHTPSSSASSLETRFIYTAFPLWPNNILTYSIQGFSIANTGAATLLPNASALLPNLPAPLEPSQPAPGDYRAGTQAPVGIVIDPQNRFLYVLTSAFDLMFTGNYPPTYSSTWEGSAAVAGFQLDQQTGALTPVPGSPFIIGQQIYSSELLINPNGKFLYAVADGGLYVFKIDVVSGALAAVPGSPVPYAQAGDVGFGALAFDVTGHFLLGAGGSNAASWAVDQNTGIPGALISEVSTNTFADMVTTSAYNLPGSITISSDGRFCFIGGEEGIAVLQIGVDGSLTPVAGSPFQMAWSYSDTGEQLYVQQLVFDPVGQSLYASAYANGEVGGNQGIWMFHVDPSSGALSPSGGVFSPQYVGAMAIDATGQFLFVPGQLQINFELPLTGPAEPITYSIASDGTLTPVSSCAQLPCPVYSSTAQMTTVNLPVN